MACPTPTANSASWARFHGRDPLSLNNMNFTDPAYRSTYSKDQLHKYFDRIFLPEEHRIHLHSERQNATPNEQLSLLANLKKYHLAAIPFENLELHYSPTKTVSLEPQFLFQKIVSRGHGRGGRCMETNCLFGTVLRSLGFDVYSAGARVNEAAQPVAATKGWKGPRHDGWFVSFLQIASFC